MIEYSDINPLQTYLCIILFSFSEDKIQGRFVVLKKALFLLNWFFFVSNELKTDEGEVCLTYI